MQQLINTNPNDQEQKDDFNIDFKRLFFKYLAYWKWFVLSCIFFITIGVVFLFTTTPVYEINASILIKDDKKMGSSSNMILDQLDLFSSGKLVENEIEILRSYTLMGELVNNLNLDIVYTYQNGLKTVELYKNSPIKAEIIASTEDLYEEPLKISFPNDKQIHFEGKNYDRNTIVEENFGKIKITVNDSLFALWDKTIPITIQFTLKEVLIESLRKNIEVKTSAKGTSVIYLTLLSPTPQKGKDILNKLIESYNSAAITEKNSLARKTLDFIEERLELLSKDLTNAEKIVEDYKSSHGITDISAEAQLFLEAVQKNDIERNQVEIQLSVLQNIEQYISLRGDKNGITPSTLGVNDPTLLSLIENLTLLESERSKALHTMKPANPAVLALNDQIKGLKQNILDNIQVLKKSLEIKQKKISAENKRIESIIHSVPQKERELVDITPQKEIKNQLDIYLLSKKEETAISNAATVSDSRLVDAARSSLKPVKPVKRNVILILGLLGILFPIGILWIKDLFYNKIDSKEEVEKKVHAPILGEISFLSQVTKIFTLNNSKGRHAEQIRTLRTNLEFMHAGGVQSILITSSISGEGKSFLTANLGAAFAALGKRTVVLGFDLRLPGLHKVFGIENEKGLSNYLIGQNSLQQVAQKVEGIENLDIITCGHIPPNPQELIQGASVSKLFEELKKEYEYIIIDTPPVGLVSDAQILSQYVDASIFVMRQNYTPRDRLKFINELYKNDKINNLGIVINGIKEDKWHGYYSSYGNEKYYGKYYNEDRKTKRRKNSTTL